MAEAVTKKRIVIIADGKKRRVDALRHRQRIKLHESNLRGNCVQYLPLPWWNHITPEKRGWSEEEGVKEEGRRRKKERSTGSWLHTSNSQRRVLSCRGMVSRWYCDTHIFHRISKDPASYVENCFDFLPWHMLHANNWIGWCMSPWSASDTYILISCLS